MKKLWLAVGMFAAVGLFAAVSLGTLSLVNLLQGATRVGAQGFGGHQDALDQVSDCCRFDILRWEAAQVTRFALTLALVPPLRKVTDEDLATVRRFFSLTRDIARADFDLNREGVGAQRASLAERLEGLKNQQEKLRPKTERVIAALVTNKLQESGLSKPMPLRPDLVWPPVAFTMQRPPSVLVVSPRSEIKQERLWVLEPGLTDTQIENLEQDTEALGWSSIVEPTGGYSTYPTIISNTSGQSFAVNSAAHEWSHTYLFFKPLGGNYFRSREMRSINETVADIIGRETSAAVMQQYFPASPTQGGSDGAAPAFDFRSEMRETRLEAERLLARGNVTGAEAYMEERRQRFVQRGYNIRRLNQAYFAFHGAYADSPGSVSPIGPQLDALFQKTGSLHAFVAAIEDVASFDEYNALLRNYGIQEVTP